MKNRIGLVLTVLASFFGVTPFQSQAQFHMSIGHYTQNFDSLTTSGTANPWTDNVTLPGWYSSRNGTNTASYRGGDGTSNAGDLWSYGVTGVSNFTDRALGSVASGPATPIYFGLRLTNDSEATFTNFIITVTAEQWRSGGNTSPQTLSFSYQVSNTPLTNAALTTGWVNFSALDFLTPSPTAGATALDGNASTNRHYFPNVHLTGVSLGPSQEIFFRWGDVNDPGNDHGFGIDDLTVLFNLGDDGPPSAPVIITQPESQTAVVGDSVSFSVIATGNPSPAYQWQFSGTNIAGATSPTLTLNNLATNQSGDYLVIVTNTEGVTNSEIATLNVVLPPPAVPGFTLMTYNTKGFGTTDWSSNAPQVQAIGRQLRYLQPDIVTFQEIPYTNRYQMANWVVAYLPGYYLATNSATDGLLSSAILSRFPITRSKSWLHSADLAPFGYTNSGNFTRDLFEAQIAMPGFPQPLHVFTVHLKSGQGSDDSNRRGAEALAISNFLAQGFLTTNSLHPYLLTGDMNEDIGRPPSPTNPQSIQRLTSTPTGLRLTTPVNPFSNNELTHSIQTGLVKRYDYILPCMLLVSNIASSQVFRTDLLPGPPPPLFATDSEDGSDHLPVLMMFNNPYDKPFRLLSITRTTPTVMLRWESVPGQLYRVEASSNLTTWSQLANNLVATGANDTFSTNLNDATRHFRIYRVP